MPFTYKGLSATLTRHIVTDEEVTRQIEKLRQSHPRIAVVNDRPTRLGDEVILDYAGFCGEEQFAGGTAENQTLTLGSGMFIPGFEEQLVDKVPGQQITVHVTFPKEYHAKNLAGKEARFQCTIHQIRVKTQYELDDVFAQEVGGCYTFPEMQEQMKKNLQAHTDQRGEADLLDRLLAQAAATLDTVITDEARAAAVEDQMQFLRSQLQQQGLSLEMYCQFLNTTEQALREEAVPAAENAVRARAAVEKIAQLENLTVTDEDLSQALSDVCRQSNMTLEQLKPYFDDRTERELIHSILTGKVVQLIREHAVIAVV